MRNNASVSTYTGAFTHIYQNSDLYSIALTIRTEGGATKQAVLLDEVLVSPKVVYADAANGANAHYPYDTPATATPCLETAIDTAGNGSTVLVADGTYAATNTVGFVVDKAIRILSLSGNPAACVATEASVTSERRVMTINHALAFVSGLTLQGGQLNTGTGATLNFGNLGGMVSNCVIRLGYACDWGGSVALAQVSAGGVITHSILEDGLARDDFQTKNGRPDTCSVDVAGLVANCLIRNFNRQADNQNIVTVRNGGKLLNCTIVDGLCGNANNEEKTACVGVVAKTGARIENCAIAGFRYREENESFTVRAWRGDDSCFVNCATDTAEPVNASCITITTEAFRNYANADYRAAGASSPLVNAGVNNELADGTDFTGGRRRAGTMDIGCYECLSGGLIIQIR